MDVNVKTESGGKKAQQTGRKLISKDQNRKTQR